MRTCDRRVDDDTYWGYMETFALFACINRDKTYLAALAGSGPPV